jgi:HAD superfamily hydrolase (TIGR01509 family)
VIFDLDGVLIDSAGCHSAAFDRVFEQFGIEDFDYAEYAGRRTLDTVQDVLRRAGRGASSETIAQASRDKSRIARELINARKPIAEGCVSLLEDLARRYQLALASSGSRASVEAFLDLAGCRDLFRCVLNGEDVEFAKPHPEIYSRTIAVLGLKPSACLVVEDAAAGVEAGCAAGALVAGLIGTCTADKLRGAGAQYLIQSLAEVRDVLSGRAAEDASLQPAAQV